MRTAWNLSLIHTSPRLCRAMPQSSHHRVSLSLHRLLTRERQNVKMLAKEQLVSYGCLFFFFFLVKKPLSVGGLKFPSQEKS